MLSKNLYEGLTTHSVWPADFPQDTLLEYGEFLEGVSGDGVHQDDGVTEVFLPLFPVLDQ